MRVKNSNTLKNYEDYRFIDSADFKKIKKDGDEAGYRWINRQLDGTSTT